MKIRPCTLLLLAVFLFAASTSNQSLPLPFISNGRGEKWVDAKNMHGVAISKGQEDS